MIAVSLYNEHFDLDEVVFFLKNGDFSFFDYYSDYSEKDAVVYMKGTGCLYICNVSDDVIPEETVRLAIDVLEHLDECLEQAYDKLDLWYFVDHKRSLGKDCFTHDPKKVFELDDIIFGLEDWPHCDYIEKYCLYPETKTEADCFWMNFRCDPLGFVVKFLCDDRRLCSIKPYTL